MKKYTILALALTLCVTGLTGCRRNKGMADGTIPTTTETTAATTQETTMPTTAATTAPAIMETTPQDSSSAPQDNMTDATTPSDTSRSRSAMPGVG